jgi:hypothetical protein
MKSPKSYLSIIDTSVNDYIIKNYFMPDILHRIGIKSSSLIDVYKALTTCEGLSHWWTTDTQGDAGNTSGLVQFRFGTGGFDMKIMQLEPTVVQWQVVDGPEEWVGTKINWEMRKEGDYIIVLFQHKDWQAPVEFMHHCSTKWAIFLMSLKSFIETGKGAPYPHDVKIDNWN